MENIEDQIVLLEKEVSDERKRLSSDRLDISFGELINLYKNKELIIRPEYQRLFRWKQHQMTALIESILLSIPIPPIFVAEDQNGLWELVDGLQRVSTFISFFGDLEENVSEIISRQPITPLEDELDEDELDEETNTKSKNKWILGTGGLIKSLNGFNIDTLPINLKINLKRAVCRVEILRGESSNSMKYELFKRLNSGGSKLTPQEIRNAIYRGVNPTLNELLLRVSQNPIFQNLTKLTESKLDELYDQELILRFFAFFDNVNSINENTENFLNSFMENTVKDPDFNYALYEDLFTRCLELIDSLGNPKVFRNDTNFFVPAYFEGILIGLAQNIERYISDSDLLANKINLLKNDKDFKRLSGSSSNSKSRTRNRLKRANEIFQT
jgi:uncharacterized protein with ParB-like and HNH nuclease domain